MIYFGDIMKYNYGYHPIIETIKDHFRMYKLDMTTIDGFDIIEILYNWFWECKRETVAEILVLRDIYDIIRYIDDIQKGQKRILRFHCRKMWKDVVDPVMPVILDHYGKHGKEQKEVYIKIFRDAGIEIKELGDDKND